MLQLLEDALRSPAGSFAFVFSILALAAWLIYFVTKRVTEIKSDHKTFTGTVNKIEDHIDDIRKDLSFLKGSMDVYRAGGAPLVQSHSPISLTKEGLDVARDLSAEDIISRNWTKIHENLESKVCDKNAYDIQEYCMMTASVDPDAFFENSDLNAIKLYAYKKGNPLQMYLRVFGVIIRDKYLHEKGMDIKEVDANDPNMPVG